MSRLLHGGWSVALLLLSCSCGGTRIRVVPSSDPVVLAYVTGRSARAPDRLRQRVDARARRLGDQVEVFERHTIGYTHRTRTIDHYSGVTKVWSESRDLGEVATGYHRTLAVVYRTSERPPARDTPWTRREAEIQHACPDLHSTLECIRVRGTVKADVLGSRDADRSALCAGGLGSHCMRLGWEARRAGEQEAFLQWMRRGCEEHDWPKACETLGSRQAGLPDATGRRYRERAQALEQAQCDAGRVQGCGDEDAHRRRRCADGQLEFCRALARKELMSAAGARRVALLGEMETYCEQGMWLACLDLARVLEEPRASELAARACLLGASGGCAHLD